jgi:hypothetical protein
MHPDAILRYDASDASYLSISNVRSRIGGLFYVGTNPHMKTKSMAASVIKNGIALSAESEVGACFKSAQNGVPI